MALVTQAEAARILGITPQAIGQAITKGRLKTVLDEKGRKRIDTSTLAEDYRKTTQTRKTTAHKKAAQVIQDQPATKVADRPPPFGFCTSTTNTNKIQVMTIRMAKIVYILFVF